MPDLDADQIAANAAKPQTASVAGRSAAQVPIQDQIAAAKFQAAAAAVAGTNEGGGPVSGWRALRPARAASRGAV